MNFLPNRLVPRTHWCLLYTQESLLPKETAVSTSHIFCPYLIRSVPEFPTFFLNISPYITHLEVANMTTNPGDFNSPIISLYCCCYCYPSLQVSIRMNVTTLGYITSVHKLNAVQMSCQILFTDHLPSNSSYHSTICGHFPLSQHSSTLYNTYPTREGHTRCEKITEYFESKKAVSY